MAGRKRKQEEEGGAPKWLVTFSDLMSLLLTFFVLLLSFSTISEEDFKEAMMSLQGAFGVLPRFTGVIAPLPRLPRPPSESIQEQARKLRRRLQVIGREREVKVEFDARGGLKIVLPEAVSFASGSVAVLPDAHPILQDIAAVLMEMPDTFIEVRGHTDAQPLSEGAQFRDNYDLSYFRADAIMRQLISYAPIPMEHFEVVACGSSQPVATNDTADGRRANRRVEIYVRGLVDHERVESLFERGRRPSWDAGPLLPLSPRELEEMR